MGDPPNLSDHFTDFTFVKQQHYQYDQTEYDQTLYDHLMFDLSILYGYPKQKYRTFESRLDEMYRTYDKFVAVSLL